MLSRIVSSLIRKAIFAGIAVAVLLAIGFFTADRKDYPGRKQFEQANNLIDGKSSGAVQGDSEATRAAAAEFSSSMKKLQEALFSGGSGRSFATGGEFLTYVKRTPTAVVVLCHVPELRNYKKKGHARRAVGDRLGRCAKSCRKDSRRKANGYSDCRPAWIRLLRADLGRASLGCSRHKVRRSQRRKAAVSLLRRRSLAFRLCLVLQGNFQLNRKRWI